MISNYPWIKFINSSFMLLLVITSLSFSQNKKIERKTGIISFISTQHIYVKFESTDSIHVGDTLFYSRNEKEIPAVIIKFISSKSCAGEKVINTQLKLNDQLTAVIKTSIDVKKIDNNLKDTLKTELPKISVEKKQTKKLINKNYRGKFSMQSLSSFSNTYSNDNQRWRYSFSFDADSINGTGFSLSSYMFFAYNTKDWSDIKNNIGDALKIYDLSIGYKFKNKNRIWLGRYLNPKISNVGSIDGLQYQNQLGKFYIGGVVGSHPDFSDYGYNIKMFEYGGYFGRVDSFATSQMENTVAIMNQTNNFTTDRRYLYFQHTNNLISNTNFFASTELDLYKTENGSPKNSISLTSLFLNLYVTPIRLISFSLSFDARRNAIYYETYKTYIESLLSNELRQGYRASIYLRPLNSLSISLNGGYNFQNGDPKPSNNFGTNIYYSEIPFLGMSANFSYSKLNSSYTNGTISGVRFNRYVNELDLNFSLDYRNIKYEFDSGLEPVIQNIISGDISFRLPWDTYFGINYEGVFEKLNTYGRFYIDLTKRF